LGTAAVLAGYGAFLLAQSAPMVHDLAPNPPVGSGMELAQGQASQYQLTESLRPASRPVQFGSLGLSAGGAADIGNFRENVANGYLPLHTDITYEGLFAEYYFDTGSRTGCGALFCPSYSYAVSADPFSGDREYYLSVGLNSGLKEADFSRKDLNLVIVVDVSGSMDESFSTYHYDPPTAAPDTRTKIEIASEAVAGLVDHLGPADNLGIVQFRDVARVVWPLESMASIDGEDLRAGIAGMHAVGGTNMDAGMDTATLMIGGAADGYENRIIFLTDAMPNLGDTSREGLLGAVSRNAESGIHTTFIGIGVDFNTQLVEELTKVRGANYYSVHSAAEFKSRMVDEFEFMVTPLVFDLELKLEADGYDISAVYGSPEADRSTGEIMTVSTLFPSQTEGGQTKGGIILLKLERVSDDAVLVLSATYTGADGEPGENRVAVGIGPHDTDYYENTGVRKGALLARYADLMKAWILDERATLANVTTGRPSYDDDGIRAPMYTAGTLGPWERQSAPVQVSDRYAGPISQFREYFEAEAAAIGDQTLRQELEILAGLARLADPGG